MWTRDQKSGLDRPPHWRIRTLDQDYNFEVDEWTDFWMWTVQLIDGFENVDGDGQVDENPSVEAWLKCPRVRVLVADVIDAQDGRDVKVTFTLVMENGLVIRELSAILVKNNGHFGNHLLAL